MQAAPHLGLGALGLLAVLFAAPLTVFSAYLTAVRRRRWLTPLNPDGWAFRILSGAVLRVALCFAGSLILVLVAMMRLIGQGGPEWIAVGATIVTTHLGALAWRGMFEPQIAGPYRLAARLRAARILGAGLALAVYAIAVGWMGAGDRPDIAAMSFRSVVVEQAVSISGQWRLLEAYALGQLATLGAWGRSAAVLATLVGNLALLWMSASLVAATMLRRSDWRVGFAPVGRAHPRISGWAWISAVLTVLTAFVFFPALASIEWSLSNLKPEDRPDRIFVTQVEEIGGVFFEPGTIEDITGRRAAIRPEIDPDLRADLHAAADQAFDRIAENVDPLLDWYYALPAEYARIAHLLAGDFESYLAEQIETRLFDGRPLAPVEAVLRRIDSANLEQWKTQAQDLAAQANEKRVDLAAGQPFDVTGKADPAAVFGPSGAELAADVSARLRARLGVAGGGAGVAAAMTASIMAKLGAKGVSKLAAKAVLKTAASKAAGGAAGAGVGSVVGGVVGSVLPGLGTAIGAAVGGALGGVAFGLGVDALLLELEETLHRDDLKAALLEALNASRAEAHSAIEQM